MPGELSSRLLQAGSSSYYHDLDNNGGGGGGSSMLLQALSDVSNSQSQGSFGYEQECQNSPLSLDEVDNLEKTADINIVDHNINNNKTNNFLAHGSSALGDNGFLANSLINFKNGGGWTGGFTNGKASLLSFEQNHQTRINQHKDIDYSFIWKDDGNNVMSCHGDYNSREVTISDPSSSSSYHFLNEISGGTHQPAGNSLYGLLYSDSTVVAADRVQETWIQGGSPLKRPYTGNLRSQPPKKQCTSVIKGSSSKPSKLATSKDPQSIAAKNRRERISERLKILQELVPNGRKVDLVTMLEKAISYVKFLQLQVKVLATDEFWPAQGLKAPDISQVKEAIDAILASQRERSSSSK